MTRPSTSNPRASSHVHPIIQVAAALLLNACASQAPTSTGFLANDTALVAGPEAPNRRVYVAGGFNPAAYDGWTLLPVRFTPGPATENDTDAETQAALLAHLAASLAEKFDARLPRRAAPGPRTLVVRASITGVERANPVLNAVTTAAVFTPVTAGGASAEMEVLDGATSTRLVALSAADNGGLGLGFPVAYFQRYGHARRALSRQATALADLAAPLPAITAR